MGRAIGVAIASIIALAPLAMNTCGDVTENTQAAASGSGGTNDGAKTDPKRRSKGGGMNAPVDAGAGGAAGSSDAAGASGDAIPTDPIEPAFTCSICVRAENCCKAQGLTDCNYGSACANATPLEQSQFYLVLCRAVLEASGDGDNVPPDVCSF
jgi:hypothetical protein